MAGKIRMSTKDTEELREASLRMGVNLYLYVLSQLVP